MRQIYNEGRVVGLSPYELYIRQLLSSNPEATPMSEREWLANMLSESSSMILCIPKGTEAGYHDYVLPDKSDLAGYTIIHGSLFQGEVTLSDDGHWATSVTDYGPLISNTAESHPVTPGESANIPTKSRLQPLTTDQQHRIANYIKIPSAILIQPGTWTDSSSAQAKPYSVLEPDFSKRAFVRLYVASELTTDVLIWLQGFEHKSKRIAQTSLLPDTFTSNPENGDFLGPVVYPWSCPIDLAVTTDIAYDIYGKLNTLGALHNVKYLAPLLTEDEQELLTENEERLLTDLYGTVKDMWDEDGELDLTENAAYLVEQLTRFIKENAEK